MDDDHGDDEKVNKKDDTEAEPDVADEDPVNLLPEPGVAGCGLLGDLPHYLDQLLGVDRWTGGGRTTRMMAPRTIRMIEQRRIAL